MHKTSYINMSRFVQKYLKDKEPGTLSVLDIGSQDVGVGSYRTLFDKPGWKYVGMDITEGKNVDVTVKNIYHWDEILPDSFDVVVSGQALEHIEYPWITMDEIRRALKKGGLCCIIVPSAGPEHRYPLDCYRFFPDGMKALAKHAGLETIECYNCWNLPTQNEQDNQWKDTVLIAKKTEI